jgi:alkaline phosphatase D
MSRFWTTTRARIATVALTALIVGGASLPAIGAQQATPTAATPTAATPTAVANPSPISVSHGIASGDVTTSTAIVWARASSGPAQMHVEYATDRTFAAPTRVDGKDSGITDATDLTGQMKLEGLQPDTIYFYRVWFTNAADQRPAAGPMPVGMFRTAPPTDGSRPVSFIMGGDIGGQQYCRRQDVGYQIFRSMQALTPDFFIPNGDSIYADGYCPPEGPGAPYTGWTNIPGDFPKINDPSVDWTNTAQVADVYAKHWRYNRADPHFQAFLEQTPVYAQWDDHEVINDFGALWGYQNKSDENRAGFPNLVQAGRDNFFWWYPIAHDPSDPNRIYRSFSYGKDLDLFLLDQRSYRSRNDAPDGPDKTLLGADQLKWLEQSLLDSKATWKVISADTPLAVPTGSDDFGRDSWANGPTKSAEAAKTGFEYELKELLSFIDEHHIQNVVFMATDVHFAQITKFDKDVNGDGQILDFYEILSGPLNAVSGPPPDPDPTYNPTVVYAEGNLFNFAYVRVQPGTGGKVHFIADIRDENGIERPGSYLDLTPQ